MRSNACFPPERERSALTTVNRVNANQSHRSLSPPPIYDSQGRQTNTRGVRYRNKLEDCALNNGTNFRTNLDFQQQKRSQRPSQKVYIPVKEFPDINFFGLLVGPRGNSLKKMERDSGAKISIRGKGSVKEGKARQDTFATDTEEELHCLVLADSEDKVAACVKLINKVIDTVRLGFQIDSRSHCNYRQHRLPKVKMTTNVASFANWQP